MSHYAFNKKIFEYESLFLEKFNEIIQRIHYKNYNEIHILTSSPEASTEIIYFIYDYLGCRLVTMICTDERYIENRREKKVESSNSKHAIDLMNKRYDGLSIKHVFSSKTEDIFFIVTSSLPNVDKPTYPSIVSHIP